MNDLMARVTSLGRPIDVRHASNRYVLVASLVSGVVGGIVSLGAGEGLVGAAGTAVVAGLAAFTAWAVAREIDPDHPASAALASPLALAALLLGRPFLAAVFAVILGGRIVVRTTGLAIRPADAVVLVGFAGYLGTTPAGAIGIGGLAVAVLVDGVIEQATGWRRWLAPMVVVTGAISVLVAGEWPGFASPGFAAAALVLSGVLGAVAMGRSTPTSRADHTGTTLDAVRLKSGRLVALLVSIAYAGVGGGAAIAGLGPVFAAFAAAGGFAVWRRRSPESRPSVSM